MNIEEKPYLQDLFNHMSNEHGLILTQSEMLDIVSICVTGLSVENEKLREALMDIVLYTDDMQNAKTDFDYNMSSTERKAAIIRAKQLITEEK